MSIWGSFCTFGEHVNDPPYLDFIDSTGHWATDEPESIQSVPRGGSVDLATTACPLVRLIIEDDRGHGAEVYLDRRQLRRLHENVGNLLDG